MNSDSDNESHDPRLFNDEYEYNMRPNWPPKSCSSVDWISENGSILAIGLDKDEVRTLDVDGLRG